jgi:hypothetical protein
MIQDARHEVFRFVRLMSTVERRIYSALMLMEYGSWYLFPDSESAKGG